MYPDHHRIDSRWVLNRKVQRDLIGKNPIEVAPTGTLKSMLRYHVHVYTVKWGLAVRTELSCERRRRARLTIQSRK
jgi:hypothetical protein